jgi:hypothetical protein
LERKLATIKRAELIWDVPEGVVLEQAASEAHTPAPVAELKAAE